MSPYIDKKTGKKTHRVTEVISASECRGTAAIEKQKGSRAIRTTHLVTIPGTLAHAKIEKFIYTDLMKRPPKKTILGEASRQLIAKVFKEHKIAKKANKDAITTYMDIMKKVDDCYARYLQFNKDYPSTPILVEIRLYSTKRDLGGTVDYVALYEKIKGEIIIDTPYPGVIPKGEYLRKCEHKAKDICNCKEYSNAIGITDWKTSSRKQKGHRLQMSAYALMLWENGHVDKWRERGFIPIWQTMSVLLGEHKLKKLETPYQIAWYDPSPLDFLASWDIHQNPVYDTQDQDGKTGLKGRCMFCSFIHECPDRVTWTLDGERITFLPMTTAELSEINKVLGKVYPNNDPIARKIRIAAAKAKLEDQKLGELLIEAENEIETILQLPLDRNGDEIDYEEEYRRTREKDISTDKR